MGVVASTTVTTLLLMANRLDCPPIDQRQGQVCRLLQSKALLTMMPATRELLTFHLGNSDVDAATAAAAAAVGNRIKRRGGALPEHISHHLASTPSGPV